jgi:hypothetical protein
MAKKKRTTTKNHNGPFRGKMADLTPKEIKIKRVNPEGITPIHVNDMLVGHDGKEIYLTFAEIEPPLLLDEEALSQLVSVDAVTKVKLVMSPEFLDAIVKALTENLEKFKLVRKSENG